MKESAACFKICIYIYLIEEGNLLFEALHGRCCRRAFCHSLKDLGVQIRGHCPIGQLARREVDDVDHPLLGVFDGVPHLRGDIDLLREVVFILAADGSQQDGLHLIGTQFGVVDPEYQLVGFDAFQKHGHSLVGLKTHGKRMVLGLVPQFEDTLLLVVLNEMTDNQIRRDSNDERRHNGNDNQYSC